MHLPGRSPLPTGPQPTPPRRSHPRCCPLLPIPASLTTPLPHSSLNSCAPSDTPATSPPADTSLRSLAHPQTIPASRLRPCLPPPTALRCSHLLPPPRSSPVPRKTARAVSPPECRSSYFRNWPSPPTAGCAGFSPAPASRLAKFNSWARLAA